jgi:NAD(P)-dependent dehydrogenase (short-subunit alcohol dehydrogenase family)
LTKPTTKGTALVTGASARIGKAIALSLGLSGYKVAVHYRGSRQDADETASDITSKGGVAEVFSANLAEEDEVEDLFEDAATRLGPITCLINNASQFENDDLKSMTRASWDAHIEPNLRAPLRLSQLLAETLGEGKKGNIINLIDQRVLKLTPQFLSYTVSKAALWTLTQTLAQALAPNIRVNAIAPGPTLRNQRQSEADFQQQIDATLLKRGASLEELTRTVNFILSTPSMTGQMIALDGGQHLIWQTPDVVGNVE